MWSGTGDYRADKRVVTVDIGPGARSTSRGRAAGISSNSMISIDKNYIGSIDTETFLIGDSRKDGRESRRIGDGDVAILGELNLPTEQAGARSRIVSRGGKLDDKSAVGRRTDEFGVDVAAVGDIAVATHHVDFWAVSISVRRTKRSGVTTRTSGNATKAEVTIGVDRELGVGLFAEGEGKADVLKRRGIAIARSDNNRSSRRELHPLGGIDAS